jgi:replicative DNA helicase
MSGIPDLRGFDAGLPANVDAEKTILGAVLLDNSAFCEAAERINADDFSLDSHRRIFLRMKALMDGGHQVDIVTLAEELAREKEVEAIGGVAYLASLTEGLPRRPVIGEYILIVKDKCILRRLMGLGSAMVAQAADQSEAALSVVTWAAGELESIVANEVTSGVQVAAEVTIEVLDRFNQQAALQQSPGLSFGVAKLDEATGGIQSGEQCVLGCYSGVGKTTLLAQTVAANCSKGVPCAMFLIEPTRHDFMRRLWSIVGDIRYGAVTKPWTASKEERDRVRWAAEQVINWPLYLLDRSNLTLDELLAHARLAMHRHGVELLGVDYLQRLKVKSEDREDNVRLKIGRASTAIADLVKNTSCRSMVLSQFNRAGGMAALPTMDKLRESGQIENDAATIVLLHLDWDEEQGHFKNTGSGIVAKQRFGVPSNEKLYKDQRTAMWMSGEPPLINHPAILPYWADTERPN